MNVKFRLWNFVVSSRATFTLTFTSCPCFSLMNPHLEVAEEKQEFGAYGTDNCQQ
jgi:hypothetical protein